MLETSRTIQRLHQKRLAHRDIKSENIAIATSRKGRLQPILLDLGCMRKQRNPIKSAAASNIDGLEGTPCYLPPQLNGCETNFFAQDVFALGATLYEIISYGEQCGKLCIDISRQTQRETNYIVYLYNTKQSEIIAAIINLDTSQAIKELLKKMLVLESGKRCTIKEVIESLETILNSESASFLNECPEKPLTPRAPLLKDPTKPDFAFHSHPV